MTHTIAAASRGDGPDVTIVMPCLDETISLPHCIANAQDALALMRRDLGLSGEIVIADNGSTDGSQALATRLGARVVPVARRGYGAALIGGAQAARGRFIVMGDCDGSYDFTESVAMVARLMQGDAVCMGSRFLGGIAPGAMPWKNRYIGNPVLSGILNLFFRSGIEDAHCGLRALTREAFLALGLKGSGMEFASEMVIKASLKGLPMSQVPATLSPDLRDRAPHLRPWRDGWRHLRYLLMLSPTWMFGVPALVALGAGLFVLLYASLGALGLHSAPPFFGVSWTMLAAMLVAVGHLSGLMAVVTHLYGVVNGYRRPKPWIVRMRRWLSLETMAVSGGALVLSAFAGFVAIGSYWTAGDFVALPDTLPVVLACTAGAVGMQNIFGGFLLAVLGGHEAAFADTMLADRTADDEAAALPTPLNA